MQPQSMLIRHRCTARSKVRGAKPNSIPSEIVAGSRTKTAVVIVQLVLTLRFTSQPSVEVSQAARLRRVFEPHHKQLTGDLPEPQV